MIADASNLFKSISVKEIRFWDDVDATGFVMNVQDYK